MADETTEKEDTPAVTLAEPLTSAHESVIPLIGILKEAGIKPDEIEDATGLTDEQLADPNLRVRMSASVWLWERAAEVTGEPDIGLTLVERYPDNHMHFVAHLAMRSRTIGEAILQWRDYAHLVCDADEISFSLTGSMARLRYRLLDPRFESRFIADHYLSMGLWYGRMFAGQRLTAREVTVRHPDPGYRETYEALFGCPVRFGANENDMAFDPAITEIRQVTADPYLQTFLREQAEAMDNAENDCSVLRLVTRIVTASIARGQTISLPVVASELAMSERSLSRALRTEGLSFREVVDLVRRDIAATRIDQGMSVAQVTYLLGFSEAAALHHAFARWFGMSIGQFRRRKETGPVSGGGVSAYAAGALN